MRQVARMPLDILEVLFRSTVGIPIDLGRAENGGGGASRFCNLDVTLERGLRHPFCFGNGVVGAPGLRADVGFQTDAMPVAFSLVGEHLKQLCFIGHIVNLPS